MLPFDRLFRLIDESIAQSLISTEVFGQIGESTYQPKNYSYRRFIDKSEYDKYISESTLVIAHAGIGVIMECLKKSTPLLVLARKAELKEHVNDHQISTAKKFEELGHVLSFDENNFEERLLQIKSFEPKPRNPNIQGISDRVAEFIREQTKLKN